MAWRPPPMPQAGTAGALPLGYFRDQFLDDIITDPYADSNIMQVDTVLTEMIQVQHPRTLLILFGVEFALSVQIMVFGLICKLYGGCPFACALWMPVVFIVNCVLAFILLRVRSTKPYLLATLILSVLSVVLCIILFIITACLLETEDNLLRASGFDAVKEHLFQLNRIVENTKIAMYTLHLVLTPILGVCCVVIIIILGLTWKDARAGRIRKGYYVSTTPIGHQNVLVPVDLKQVKQVPQSTGKTASVAVQTL